MFSAMVVTPEKPLAEGLDRLAVGSGQVTVYKTIDHYPPPYELTRILNACDPDLLFLDIGRWEHASQIAAVVREKFPRTAIIAFGGGWVEGRERYCANIGISAHLVSPITVDTFRKGVTEGIRSVRSSLYKNLVAFLPAKAGTGCSLTVLHVATWIAGFGKKVLVIDGDLGSGVLGVRWQLPSHLHLQDALCNPEALNRNEWGRFIVSCRGVDILAAGSDWQGPAVQWSNYYHLLEFVTGEYNRVLVDLPESLDDADSEVVLRASGVFLITTAENTSLELAQRRLRHLTGRGVDPARIHVILNRSGRPHHALPPQAEDLLRRRVAAVFPEDADGIRRVEFEGKAADPGTELGHALLALSSRIAGVEMPAYPVEKPKSRLAAFLGR